MIERQIKFPQPDQLLYDVLAGRSVTLLGGGKEFDMDMINDCTYLVHANWHHLAREKLPPAAGVYLESQYIVDLPVSPVFIGVRVGADSEGYYRRWAKQRNIITVGWDFATYEGLNPFGASHEWCNVLSKRLGTMPFTGVVALTHLLRFPITKLNVTGMDLFASGGAEQRQLHYEDKIQNEWYRDNHAIGPQIRYLREVWKTDARFKPDATLLSVLTGEWGHEELVVRYDSKAIYKSIASRV